MKWKYEKTQITTIVFFFKMSNKYIEKKNYNETKRCYRLCFSEKL